MTIERGFVLRAPVYDHPAQERVTSQDVSASHSGLAPVGAVDTSAAECELTLAHAWDYLDGHCSADVAGRIIAHVPSCSSCSRHLLIQEQFLSSLADLRERPAAPTRLHESVRATLAADREAHPEISS